MQQNKHRLLRPLALLALAGPASLAVSIAGAIEVKSQEILPYDFIAAPAGTNILLYYHFYGHDTEYTVRNGPTIKNSGLEINTDLAVYGHFFSVAGHPFLLQLKQNFGSLSGGYVGGQGLGSVYGAGVTNVTASFWPYSNAATRTNVSIVGSLNLPDGTYDPRSPLNIGSNRVTGNVQFGVSKGLSDCFAFDAAFDVALYGDSDNYFSGGQKLSQSPTPRGQLWLNWAWSTTFTTSFGWEGLFGGREQVNRTFNGNATYEQRVRAAASLFVTPTVQTILELNHDVAHSGNYKQEFGATFRLLYLF